MTRHSDAVAGPRRPTGFPRASSRAPRPRPTRSASIPTLSISKKINVVKCLLKIAISSHVKAYFEAAEVYKLGATLARAACGRVDCSRTLFFLQGDLEIATAPFKRLFGFQKSLWRSRKEGTRWRAPVVLPGNCGVSEILTFELTTSCLRL